MPNSILRDMLNAPGSRKARMKTAFCALGFQSASQRARRVEDGHGDAEAALRQRNLIAYFEMLKLRQNPRRAWRTTILR
jgi:hypothetical protein